MADAEVVYGVSMQGYNEVMAALRSTYTEQLRAAELAQEIEAAEREAHAEDRARTAESMKMARDRAKAGADAARTQVSSLSLVSSRLGVTADAVKLVGKDLDNMGLKAGKAFAMTAEGALSVVAAVGAGGVVGAIGAATVAVGALVQGMGYLLDAHKREEEAAQKTFATFRKHASDAAASIAESRKKLTMEDVERREIEILGRRAANEGRHWDLMVEGEKLTQMRILNERFGVAQGTLDDEIVEQEKKVANLRLDIEKEFQAQAEGLRTNGINRAKVFGEKLVGALEEGEKKAADKRVKNAEEAAQKVAKQREAELAHLQKLHDADMALNDAKWAKEDKDKADAAAKKKKADDEEMARLERLQNLEADKAEEDGKAAKRANEEAAKSEKHRREELAKTAKALQEKHEQEVRAMVATQASAAANIAFGVSATVTGPIIAEYTGLLKSLGDINRDNYREFVLFSDELPAIIAKKTQAIMGGIAAEATGKALQSSADAAREMALGLGLVAIPGMGAQAAGHFTSAGSHMLAASMYGALGTGAAVGAVGLGAMRGSGGPIALTREEQQRNASRDGGGAGGGISGGRMSGSGGGAGEAFVVNIAYQAGSIAPADENRAARTVASATRRARSNAFDRRRMGA